MEKKEMHIACIRDTGLQPGHFPSHSAEEGTNTHVPASCLRAVHDLIAVVHIVVEPKGTKVSEEDLVSLH